MPSPTTSPKMREAAPVNWDREDPEPTAEDQASQVEMEQELGIRDEDGDQLPSEDPEADGAVLTALARKQQEQGHTLDQATRDRFEKARQLRFKRAKPHLF